MIEPPLVAVASAVPDVVLDIRYAVAENFLGRAVYPFAGAFLRKPAAEKLTRAAAILRREGYRLVVYDAYRPLSAQRLMWALKPDWRFVADPARRGSMHNRGAAVDVSLADTAGRSLAMPSGFDAFSERARHSYKRGAAEALRRRAALRAAMEAAGFMPLAEEWWHYSDQAGRDWPLLDIPFDALAHIPLQ